MGQVLGQLQHHNGSLTRQDTEVLIQPPGPLVRTMTMEWVSKQTLCVVLGQMSKFTQQQKQFGLVTNNLTQVIMSPGHIQQHSILTSTIECQGSHFWNFLSDSCVRVCFESLHGAIYLPHPYPHIWNHSYVFTLQPFVATQTHTTYHIHMTHS